MIPFVQDAVADADLADWVTVFAYGVAALLCWRAAQSNRASRNPNERWAWRLAIPALLFLGVNELLDLQTLLTALGKAHAQANGWYADRRQVQYAFVIGLAVAAIVSGAWLLCTVRSMAPPVRCAIIGFATIGIFIVLRAASFHHADEFLGSGFRTFNVGSLQELFGIALIAIGAIAYAAKRTNS